MVEHNNGRLNTTGLGPIGPTPTATQYDVRQRPSPQAFWNFIAGPMKRDNYAAFGKLLTKCDPQHVFGVCFITRG